MAHRTGRTALVLKKNKILVGMEIRHKLLVFLLVTEDQSEVTDRIATSSSSSFSVTQTVLDKLSQNKSCPPLYVALRPTSFV